MSTRGSRRRRSRNAESSVAEAARDVLGYTALHPGQEDAIRALLDGRDVLAVLPTGSGKTAIYELAGTLLGGLTLVVSPLLALQRDQVSALEEHRLKAAALNSALSQTEQHDALRALESGVTRFLLLSPEQLAHAPLLETLGALEPVLTVVDEAHTVSEWGHDFRPEYLHLAAAFAALGRPPLLALTATASPPVRAEIIERLHMRGPAVIVTGFDRPNIHLAVERFDDDNQKRNAAANAVVAADSPTIVYANTHRHVEEFAKRLRDASCRAVAYHAGMKQSDRTRAETDFMDGDADVIVATNAFGMGIDKPDVRTVAHVDAPESLDAYHQEIGRAGRDGDAARAILFYRPQDLALHRFFSGGKLSEDDAQHVAAAVEEHAEADDAPDVDELAEETGLKPGRVESVVTRLEDAGAVERGANASVERADGLDAPEAAAERALDADERRREFERSRLEMMRAYAETHRCRRHELLAYFGEDSPERCGNCDNDDRESSEADDDRTADVPFPVGARVHHTHWGDGMVQGYDGEVMTALFAERGYKQVDWRFLIDRGLLHTLDEG